MADYSVFWGETHDNTYQTERQPAPFAEILKTAAAHLDFYAAAYYTSTAAAFTAEGHPSESDKPSRLILEGWKSPERLEREWTEVQALTREANRPGEFVTFPGYEWQGDGSSGDHNVFAFEEGLPIFRVDTIAELYECLRGRRALAIPHHTAYRPGVRGRDWAVFDEELSPFTEIFSIHGCSETDEELMGLRRNPHMGPGVAGGTYQEALDRGLHIGAICSTDGWGAMPGAYGDGLVAALAREPTREGLWESFAARRVYGVTGDRILIDFRVNGAPMGSIITGGGARTITVEVTGCDALDRIEILRSGRVIATHCHQGTWETPPPGKRTRFKMRIEAGWGPRANELTVPERKWRGKLEVAAGRILSSEPCWISPGQSRPVIKGGGASFEMVTSAADTGRRWQNANIFEFEADPEAPLSVRMNGLEEAGAVADFARGSREMWFRDDCVRMLEALAGIAPGSPERHDIYHHVAFKAKIHRAVPEAAYTASLSIEDDGPLAGEANYRVRVEQRNGQRAWSSPVWVSPAVP